MLDWRLIMQGLLPRSGSILEISRDKVPGRLDGKGGTSLR